MKRFISVVVIGLSLGAFACAGPDSPEPDDESAPAELDAGEPEAQAAGAVPGPCNSPRCYDPWPAHEPETQKEPDICKVFPDYPQC